MILECHREIHFALNFVIWSIKVRLRGKHFNFVLVFNRWIAHQKTQTLSSDQQRQVADPSEILRELNESRFYHCLEWKEFTFHMIKWHRWDSGDTYSRNSLSIQSKNGIKTTMQCILLTTHIHTTNENTGPTFPLWENIMYIYSLKGIIYTSEEERSALCKQIA